MPADRSECSFVKDFSRQDPFLAIDHEEDEEGLQDLSNAARRLLITGMKSLRKRVPSRNPEHKGPVIAPLRSASLRLRRPDIDVIGINMSGERPGSGHSSAIPATAAPMRRPDPRSKDSFAGRNEPGLDGQYFHEKEGAQKEEQQNTTPVNSKDREGPLKQKSFQRPGGYRDAVCSL
jgi:hypothetical protein